MKSFQEFLEEKIDRPVGDDSNYDFAVMKAKVVPKAAPNGPAMEIVKIVDDQQVMVKDEYGQQHKMLIRKLAPYKGK